MSRAAWMTMDNPKAACHMLFHDGATRPSKFLRLILALEARLPWKEIGDIIRGTLAWSLRAKSLSHLYNLHNMMLCQVCICSSKWYRHPLSSRIINLNELVLPWTCTYFVHAIRGFLLFPDFYLAITLPLHILLPLWLEQVGYLARRSHTLP